MTRGGQPRIAASGRALLALAVLATAAGFAPAADASYPAIQAHRGGPVVNGLPRFPENTLPAFRRAARVEHAVLELDVKLTKDGVPVVIHDDTPDKTTTCNENRPVRSYTLTELRGCRADVLGSPGGGLRTRRVARATVRIPTLSQVLRLARRRHARVNVEINNPTDNDFDPTEAFADRVIGAIAASRLPHARVMVQSYLPQNLTRVEERLFDVETSFLTLDSIEAAGRGLAADGGFEWASPQFPVDAAYVSRAHDRGLRVVPYRLDTPTAVRAAARSGLTTLVDRMEEAGLLRREPPPNDRRAIEVVLTEASHRRFEEANAVHWRGIQEHFITYLDEAEGELLARLLERVNEANGAASRASEAARAVAIPIAARGPVALIAVAEGPANSFFTSGSAASEHAIDRFRRKAIARR